MMIVSEHARRFSRLLGFGNGAATLSHDKTLTLLLLPAGNFLPILWTARLALF